MRVSPGQRQLHEPASRRAVARPRRRQHGGCRTMTLVTHDRGLGTAYERYCFYQRLDAWATEYCAETMLEGPLDGMAGIAAVHGAGLARRGVRVTSVTTTDDGAAL